MSRLAPLVLAVILAAITAACGGRQASEPQPPMIGELLPTGQRITPLAAPGALFQPLNPALPGRPDYIAGQAVELATSPDGAILLVLTSGYNRMRDAAGRIVPEQSSEFVFVYDITGAQPVQRQVLAVANSFNGMAWRPDGSGFLVAGGVDDDIHVFSRAGALFVEDGAPIALGHTAGLGPATKPMAAGLAISPDGTRLLVANYENDSVSLVDLRTRRLVAELDLRPGKENARDQGKPGGSYPLSVGWASDTQGFVASQRDRELIGLRIASSGLAAGPRIKLAGQPTKMILNRDRSRLFVAVDNSDSVVAIATSDGHILAEIPSAAPAGIFPNQAGLKGANPNNLALSPDERSLFVSDGGLNAVAVIALGGDVLGAGSGAGAAAEHDDDDDDDGEAAPPATSRVIGLLPTGWYPNAVAVRRDGRALYVVNGKSNAGPNPLACRNTLSAERNALDQCQVANQYVWQLSKAGFLALPMPDAATLARLTLRVADNDNLVAGAARAAEAETMAFLHRAIHHVVYIVKENRTYDQVLGDLEIGNGDPSLALLPAPITPNHHALARRFVTLDNFFDSGETSNTGWNWTTAGRTNDFTEKEAPVNYAGRGLGYDQEGTNRDVNVGFARPTERHAANPATPLDPDLLPGTADVAALDPPQVSGGDAGTGYLWDAALRGGLTLRNYGFFGDLARYFAKQDRIPPLHDPFAEQHVVFYPTKPALMRASDPYFRGFDMGFADFWREREWEREFAQQEAAGTMPNLTLLRLPHDHFGAFDQRDDGVDTPETQMADNDYALGRVVERIAHSRFAADTLIFVVEDDAQDGADHVDAHRSIAFVVGPYVRQGALVSKRYTTVNLLRTVEAVLGLPPLGLNDGLAAPMAELFDRAQPGWSYDAAVPAVLRQTQLPLPPPRMQQSEAAARCTDSPAHPAGWWQEATSGQFFGEEDRLDVAAFNATLWHGLMGEGAQPSIRSGADLRTGREALLTAWSMQQRCR